MNDKNTLRILEDKCTGGVYLREITKNDTDDIVRWRNNPQVKKNFIYQKDFTREGHNHWFDTMIMSGRSVQFLIVEACCDRAIGSVYLRDIDHENHKAEYGIFIGEDDARSHGYGTMACELICQYGFNELHLHKIFLRVFSENKIAQKSYKKAGFQMEGLFRDDVCIHGQFHDMIFMAKFK